MMPTEHLNIRPASAQDVPAITSIYAEHVVSGTATFDTVPRTEQATLSKLEECNQKGWPFLVAESGGEVVGYAYVTQFRDRPAYAYSCENSIYIRSDQIHRGLGKALMEKLLQAAEKAGFRQMIAVCGGGEPASVALHYSCGFDVAGRMKSVGRKAGRWLDTVYMQVALGQGDGAAPEREPT